eukprot:Nitzschia sp. Nitz4//scaffold6_size259037//224632//226191//NITZ4_001120-RA/size259037-processed-gene-0.225-mRNA-1//1//CDS//3329557031//1947//frame0
MIVSLPPKFFLSLCLLLNCLRLGFSEETFDVSWDFVPKEVFDATVGDTIRFSWITGYHDVWIHPSGDCTITDDAIPVHDPPTAGGVVSYTLQPGQGSPEGKLMFFACEVGDGTHCKYFLNQQVRVFSKSVTPAPTTAAPTIPFPSASPSTPLPTKQPSASPTRSPTAKPTPSPSKQPSATPTSSPTVRPTSSPTIAPTTATPTMSPTTAQPTKSPTAIPSTSPTASPTKAPTGMPTPDPTGQPTTVHPTNSPTAAPTPSPSETHSNMPTKVPTVTPSVSPSGSPVEGPVPTQAPTPGLGVVSVEDLSMTLYGINTLSPEDQTNWRVATTQYLSDFYDVSSDVLDFETTLEVTSTSGVRRRLDEATDSVVLSYSQILSYRLVNMNLSPVDIATDPFTTDESREKYVTEFLNALPGSVLVNVSSSSTVGHPDMTTSPPSASPVNFNPSIGDNSAAKDGISTGATVGMIVAALAILSVVGVLLARRTKKDTEDNVALVGEFVQENGSRTGWLASDMSVEIAT